MCSREKSYSCRENSEGGVQNDFVWFTYMSWKLFTLGFELARSKLC